MTTLELEAKKAGLIRFIANIDDEKIINELSQLINRHSVDYPCMHSEEEIIRSAGEAIKAYEAGEGIPHDVIKNKFSA